MSVMVWCNVAQCGAMWRNVVQCSAMWRNVVQCGAMWRNVVQCGAMWRNVAKNTSNFYEYFESKRKLETSVLFTQNPNRKNLYCFYFVLQHQEILCLSEKYKLG